MGSGFSSKAKRPKKKPALNIGRVIRKSSEDYTRKGGKDLGFSEVQVKNIAKTFERVKGPNYEGRLSRQLLTKEDFAKIYDKLDRAEMDVIFDVLDHQRKGRLSLQDVVSGFCFMCKATVTEKLRFLFKAYDTENNGSLDQGDVAGLLHDVRLKNEVLQNCIDSKSSNRRPSMACSETGSVTDGSGFVARRRSSGFCGVDGAFAEALAANQEANEAAMQVFDRYDANNDGKISDEEFAQLVEQEPRLAKFTSRIEYLCSRILQSRINKGEVPAGTGM
jgi:Ca2+-binding EF-hand superfamily protein